MDQATVGLDQADQPSAEKLGELKAAVDDAATVLRGYSLTFLLFWAFIFVVAGSMDDRKLLVGGEIPLPLLGTGVDLVAFFWVVPILFVVLHVNLVLHLYFLARRVRAFEQAVSRLPDAEQSYRRGLLTPFPYIEWRAGRSTDRMMRFIFAMTNWLMFVGLPVFLLFWVQLCFLPFQHPWVTPLHFGLIFIDLTVLWAIWPRLNLAGGSWWAGVRGLFPQGVAGALTMAIATLVSPAVLALSFLLWFDQRPDALAWLDVALPKAWCSERSLQGRCALSVAFDNRFSRLTVRDQILMKREPAPEIVVKFRAEAEAKGEDPSEGQRRAYLDRELAERLNLHGRHLRHLNLEYSELAGADLSLAQLQRARLRKAQLQGAYLREAQLQGPISGWRGSRGLISVLRSSRRPTYLGRSSRRLTSERRSLRGLTSEKPSSRGPTFSGRSSRVATYLGRRSRVPTYLGRRSRGPTSSVRGSKAPTFRRRSSRVPTSRQHSSREPTSSVRGSKAPTSRSRGSRVPTSRRHSSKELNSAMQVSSSL